MKNISHRVSNMKPANKQKQEKKTKVQDCARRTSQRTSTDSTRFMEMSLAALFYNIIVVNPPELRKYSHKAQLESSTSLINSRKINEITNIINNNNNSNINIKNVKRLKTSLATSQTYLD
ncbi:CLUMA_CG003219, isoform A [Clunio marinus]|uniref:CLUMA_CG003219, isoform A n=1 Tax=Clunio marinus TaxID=568069 RepID=A0A1J1HNF6_9DIPT|nr:CLUMA_CG003219, isoform A [Clunio marinus]